MEDELTEYKKSLAQMSDIMQAIVAFANADGGKILIGIEDNGHVAGVSIGKNTLENLSVEIARNIEPKVTVSLKTAAVNDKMIIEITVPLSPLKPHFNKGIAFKRVGRTNMKMSPQQLEQMFIKRVLSMHDIDSCHMNIKAADISEKLVKKYVKDIAKKHQTLADTLRNLNLSDNGKIYPSAVLFFGADPAGFFSLYGVKCAVFKGQEMLSLQDFQQPIYDTVEPVIKFIKQNIPSQIRFEGVTRYEEPLIPEVVIREALLNALMHADYTLDATIYVKITEDFVEIKNGGTLPIPLTVEQLEKPHISRPRNKRIAALCHRLRWIEHWGEGTLKIVNEMRKKGLDVEFEEKNGYFSTRLYLKQTELNRRQRDILRMVGKNDEIVSGELAKPGASKRTIRADLAFLVRKGFLKRVGKGKNTRYKF